MRKFCTYSFAAIVGASWIAMLGFTEFFSPAALLATVLPTMIASSFIPALAALQHEPALKTVRRRRSR